MNPREIWISFRRWYGTHSERDRRILAGVAALVALALVYVAVIEPIVQYRRRVAEEIAESHEQLARAARFLAAADTLRAERNDLRQRLEQARTRLLPGGSGTLGAAALQERANALAAEKGIIVQSTQVMKEEMADPYRKVAIRLTLSGELRPFSDFLAGLEYGPQQLTIPFVEVSRRGAVAGARGSRNLAATVEVSGYLLAEEAPTGADAEGPEGEEHPEGEPEAAPVAGDEAAPPADPPAAAAPLPAPPETSPPAAAEQPAAMPALPPEAVRPPGPGAEAPSPPESKPPAVVEAVPLLSPPAITPPQTPVPPPGGGSPPDRPASAPGQPGDA